jgi:hypothetical protein
MAMEKAANPFLRCRDLAEFQRMKSDWPNLKARLGLK